MGDGPPSDRRLGDLLMQYGAKGTFYIPSRPINGKGLLSHADIRALANTLEVGGHTEDHFDLTRLSAEEILQQVSRNKDWLDNVTGRATQGFCYPYGFYHPRIKAALNACGYRYARTTRNFAWSVGSDPFMMPTTLQFYPHAKTIYTQNILRRRPSIERLRLYMAAISSPKLNDRVRRMASLCAAQNGVFHLWGHSWELEENGLWGQLEETLKYLKDLPGVEFLTNGQVMEKQRAARAQPGVAA